MLHPGASSRLSSPTPIPPQIKNESFLEDINNVLNSGDIPNLYTPDEQDQIVNTMRPYIQEQGLQPTKANLMAAYTGRVRSNIHMVLCMRYRQLARHSGMAWVFGGAVGPAMRRGGPGLATMPLGSGCCVVASWLPDHRTVEGPWFWISGGVNQCLRTSFGLPALQPHWRGLPSSPEAVPLPGQLLYH